MNPTETRRRSLSQSAQASPIETQISFDPHASPNPDDSAESRDWSSSLINAPLHSVLCCLSSLEDLFSFRAVCRSWRSLPTTAPALSAQPPLLLLSRFPSFSESFYNLRRRRFYSTRPPGTLSPAAPWPSPTASSSPPPTPPPPEAPSSSSGTSSPAPASPASPNPTTASTALSSPPPRPPPPPPSPSSASGPALSLSNSAPWEIPCGYSTPSPMPRSFMT